MRFGEKRLGARVTTAANARACRLSVIACRSGETELTDFRRDQTGDFFDTVETELSRLRRANQCKDDKRDSRSLDHC
jgi:hypothetical protein